MYGCSESNVKRIRITPSIHSADSATYAIGCDSCCTCIDMYGCWCGGGAGGAMEKGAAAGALVSRTSCDRIRSLLGVRAIGAAELTNSLVVDDG